MQVLILHLFNPVLFMELNEIFQNVATSIFVKQLLKLCKVLLCIKPSDDPVFDYIEKKRSEGKWAKESMIAGMNKFLRIYYGKVSELYRNIEEQSF